LDKRNLLDEVFSSAVVSRSHHYAASDEALLEAAKAYNNRSVCYVTESALYKNLVARGLLEKAFPVAWENRERAKIERKEYAELLEMPPAIPPTQIRAMTNNQLVERGKQYGRATICFQICRDTYFALKKRGLMDEAFGKASPKLTEAEVLTMAKEYVSRSACAKSCPSLYLTLSKRKLLEKAFGEKLKPGRPKSRTSYINYRLERRKEAEAQFQDVQKITEKQNEDYMVQNPQNVHIEEEQLSSAYIPTEVETVETEAVIKKPRKKREKFDLHSDPAYQAFLASEEAARKEREQH
jgi:hypothetical protein